MKPIKRIGAAVGISITLFYGTAGCAAETEATQPAQAKIVVEKENAIKSTDTQSNTGIDVNSEKDASSQNIETENRKKEDLSDSAKTAQNPEQEPNKIFSPQEGSEFLPGTVQSVEADSMVIAQTTLMGEGEDVFSVTLIDEKDAKKITVKFTSETKVEHWIIQGGGSGIDMQEAALSDLSPGQGVEIEGYYEDDDFVAVKILIEEYR